MSKTTGKAAKVGDFITVSWIDAPNERVLVVAKDKYNLDVLAQRGNKVSVEHVEFSQVVARHDNVALQIG